MLLAREVLCHLERRTLTSRVFGMGGEDENKFVVPACCDIWAWESPSWNLIFSNR